MTRLKKAFRILLYLSFGFVIYYLYSFDYFTLSNLKFNFLFLILSILSLWAGFIVSTLSWRNSLKAHNIYINRNLAIYSHGISVFAKYIPGKVWVILGRASVVSERRGSVSLLSTISLKEQLLYLVIGLSISFLAMFWVPINPLYIVGLGAITIALALLLFSRRVHQLILYIMKLLLKKAPNIPYVPVKEALPMLKSIVGYWFFWSCGFYLLVLSLVPNSSILIAFAFPLSVCFGLLAVIVPGGIGVREGIIVFFLTTIGMESSLAITVSLVQRLWFISGEIFIFGLALLTKYKITKSEN